MNGLLATLLVAALGYGVRLERRLKALRDGQSQFAQAVQVLDAAALRAEAGLETLRRTTEEAHDDLHDRILKARELRAELERLIGRAERVRDDAPSSEMIEARPVAQSRVEAATTRGRPNLLPRALSPARAAPRPAARGLDEDLFEAATPADRGDS